MKRAILIPNVSFGNILFGDNIKNYSDRQYEYSDTIGKDAYSSYSFRETPVSAYVDKDGMIESISCKTECIWEGVDLIGLAYKRFNLLCPKPIAHNDRVWVYLNEDQDEQEQDVYEYDELGLQLWVFDGTIVTALATSYQDEP